MNTIGLHDKIAAEAPNIRGLTVRFRGEVVYEDTWGGYLPTDATHVMSVTKSVLALLVGMAVDRGLLPDLDAPVLSFFPDYTPPRGEKTAQRVTVRHLLTMTAPFKGRSEPWKKVCTSVDWTRTTLDSLGGREGPTGTFRYATLGLQILAGVLGRAIGKSVLSFANEALFEPCGLRPRRPHGDGSKEEQLAFILGKTPHPPEWYVDPTGAVTAGWGLTLTASEMAVIGQLCLDGGVFGGRRLVSESWIRDMTTVRVLPGETFGNMGYGYLWWIPQPGKRTFAAIGDGGNVIYVDPDREVSIGVASLFKPRVFDRIAFLEREVLPRL